LACQIAKHAAVPCLVRGRAKVDASAITLAENYYREPVNPAEEAAFLERLLTERCGGDVDRLAALIRRQRRYVEDRLLLRSGDARVLEALGAGKITMSVARELNRVRDAGQRGLYLDAALRGGATAAVVQRWRTQGEGLEQYLSELPASPTPDREPTPVTPMTCVFCGDSDDAPLMRVTFLHKHCEKYLLRILARGAMPAPTET
jgi:ParB-like chromosome segregation protein Spo0J